MFHFFFHLNINFVLDIRPFISLLIILFFLVSCNEDVIKSPKIESNNEIQDDTLFERSKKNPSKKVFICDISGSNTGVMTEVYVNEKNTHIADGIVINMDEGIYVSRQNGCNNSNNIDDYDFIVCVYYGYPDCDGDGYGDVFSELINYILVGTADEPCPELPFECVLVANNDDCCDHSFITPVPIPCPDDDQYKAGFVPCDELEF